MMTSYLDNSFNSNFAIMVIILIYSRVLQSIQACPQNCTCFNNFTGVNCSSQHLTEVLPSYSLGFTEILDLSKNIIERVGGLQSEFLLVWNLSWNHIRIIEEDDLHQIPNLEQLDLKGNLLENIHKNAFKNSTKLTHLNLQGNYLKQFPDGFFEPLKNLVYLNIALNQFDSLYLGNESSNLSQLKELDLSYNTIEQITESSLKFLINSSIEILSIKDTRIQFLEPKSLENLSTLSKVYADKIIFPVALNITIALQYLNLTVLSLANLSQLSTHNLTNLFNQLKSDSLLELDFSHNPLSLKQKLRSQDIFIKDDFSLFSNLPNLKKLVLKDCHQMTLNLEMFQSLPALEILDVSYSGIRYIHQSTNSKALQNLKELNLGNNNLFVLGEFKFLQPLTSSATIGKLTLPSLEVLELRNNNLQQVGKHAFVRMPKLRILHMYNAWRHNNDGNQLIEELFTNSALQVLDLSNNSLVHIKSNLFSNLSNLRILKLDNNRIGEIFSNSTATGIFQSLINLEYLSLKSNLITTLQTQQFEILNSLKTLILNNNLISDLSEYLKKLRKLQKLSMADNEIKILTKTHMINLPISLQEIDLTNNPLVCHCKWKEFTNLFMEKNITLVSYNRSEKYICKLKSFSVFFDTPDCYGNTSSLLYYKFVMTLLIGVIILLCIVCAISIFFNIKTIFHNTKLTSNKENPHYNSCKNVSFIAYNTCKIFLCKLKNNSASSSDNNTKDCER